MHFLKHLKLQTILLTVLASTTIILLISLVYTYMTRINMQAKAEQTQQKLAKVEQNLSNFLKEDQYVRNGKLNKNIKEIETTFAAAAKSYEELIELREQSKKTQNLDVMYAEVIHHLGNNNFSSAEATLAKLNIEIKKYQTKPVANAPTVPANVETNNTPPGSGYNRQYVKTSIGTYMVDIVAGDMNSTRVIVDTASDGTCTNDCPVTSLGDYASRSGAYAAINGPYFCPAEYPSCADKKNSFDTLIMNKNKAYFNSDNNVYSTVPAVIFSGNSARFVGQTLEWGRDTGVDAVIAAQPMLVSRGNVVFGGDAEIKRAGKGSRSFIGASGNMAYIGVVHNVNAAEMAVVLKEMGIQGALNLDSGGSTALWVNGRYVAGPGRNLPFGILFVRK